MSNNDLHLLHIVCVCLCGATQIHSSGFATACTKDLNACPADKADSTSVCTNTNAGVVGAIGYCPKCLPEFGGETCDMFFKEERMPCDMPEENLGMQECRVCRLRRKQPAAYTLPHTHHVALNSLAGIQRIHDAQVSGTTDTCGASMTSCTFACGPGLVPVVNGASQFVAYCSRHG